MIAYVDPARASSSCSRDAAPGGWPPRPAASAGSAMTRRSCPTTPGGLTMAELSDEQKDAISHRGRAARALLAWLAATAG